MIARAWYVRCDECGNPGEVSTEGARSAREYAQSCDGFVRAKVPSTGRVGDLCAGCKREAAER